MPEFFFPRGCRGSSYVTDPGVKPFSRSFSLPRLPARGHRVPMVVVEQGRGVAAGGEGPWAPLAFGRGAGGEGVLPASLPPSAFPLPTRGGMCGHFPKQLSATSSEKKCGTGPTITNGVL